MRWLVAVSTRETLAPVIAAPEGSRTLPEIDPLVCAAAGKEAKHVKRAILAAHPAMDTDGRTGWSAPYVKSKQLFLAGEKATASAAGRIKEIIGFSSVRQPRSATVFVMNSGEGLVCWRAAFAMRSLAGDASLAFGLYDDCRMAEESGIDGMGRWRSKAA